MKQVSIKNDHALELLTKLSHLTGKGKTELVIEALEHYEHQLERQQRDDLEQLITFVEEEIHANMDPNLLGKTSTKEELEEMLGMP
ncbi:MAG: type II toxin-antitoxin system VapB family antitoxin [Deinococcota bacterium]